MLANDAPGAIDALSDTSNEAEQCIPSGGLTQVTCCPACAAPLWKEAVRIALSQRHYD